MYLRIQALLKRLDVIRNEPKGGPERADAFLPRSILRVPVKLDFFSGPSPKHKVTAINGPQGFGSAQRPTWWTDRSAIPTIEDRPISNSYGQRHALQYVQRMHDINEQAQHDGRAAKAAKTKRKQGRHSIRV